MRLLHARPSRRSLGGAAALVAVAMIPTLPSLFVAAAPGMGAGERDDTRPNVLFIIIDDLNDWVGCLGGHPQAQTPVIDGLARRGVLFTNAHSQAPICNPSRVSLMTGIRPSTSGVYLNDPHFRQMSTLADVVTLPQHFAANGYRTFAAGKLFHTQAGRTEFQTYGPRSGLGPLPEQKLNCPSGQSRSPLWDWGAFPERDDQTHDVQDAKWAAKLLREKHDGPFFLGVGFYRPHIPMYAPAKWMARYPRRDIQLPVVLENDRDDLPAAAKKLTENALPPSHAWFVESGEWSHAVQSYLACVTFVDHCVGRVLYALDAGPHADNTWIVLFSDQGYHLGEKERWAKESLWERATHVPLIIVPPRKSRQQWGVGTKCARAVGLIDLYPTLVEVCGLPSRAGLEGRSLRALLEDSSGPWPYPVITTHLQNNHAVRSEHWRYIRYADGSEELYDHRSDPREWHNLAGEARHAAVIAEHRGWLPAVNLPAPLTEREKKAKSSGWRR